MTLFRDEVESPIGTLALVSDEAALRALHFIDHSGDAERMHRLLRAHYGAVDLHARRERIGIRARLEAYFAGDIRALDDVPTCTSGTPFQTTVWSALRTIPAGSTMSYSALARKLGMPTASRAVGLANGANPVGIVIPCHRVIGADGTLTGYGGGLARKAWLLRHEGVDTANLRRSVVRSDRELMLFPA